MDVEGIMRELLVRETNIVKDAPPKYEDLDIEPPQYDEKTMNTEPNNCDNNQSVQNVVQAIQLFLHNYVIKEDIYVYVFTDMNCTYVNC